MTTHRPLYKTQPDYRIDWCKIIAMPMDRAMYETRYVFPGPNHTYGKPTKFVWFKHENPGNDDFVEVIY